SLVSRQQGVGAFEITGLFDETDPADPFWFDDMSLQTPGIRSLGGDSRLIAVAGLVADAAYDALLQSGGHFGPPVRYTWRYFVGTDRLRARQLDILTRDLRRRQETVTHTQG